ncbi:NAD-dependent DNA ligase [Microcystis phage Mae-JY02]
MAQDGDIVFMIGADVTGLTRAGQAGEQSLADMEKAAKALERQIGKIGESGAAFQREMNRLTGVTNEFSKSARDSAAAFEAFDKARGQVENLRASIDPLYAASKRYEAALRQLDSALEMGAISAREHGQMMDQLAAAYLRADNAADMAQGGMGRFGGGIQQVGFQLQDFAVQVGSGTSAMQAFGQQFPQLASAFGPWGVAVGTAAAILVPLGAAFLSTSEDADRLTEALDRQKSVAEGLTAVFTALRTEREMAMSGAATEAEQAAMNEIKRLAQERVGLEAQLNALHEQANANLGVINTSELERLRTALATNEANRATNQALLESIQRERARLEAAKLTEAAARQMQTIMNQLGSADISSPWESVTGWIWNAVEAAKAYGQASMVYSGRGGDPRQFGANAGSSNTFGVENFSVPGGGGAGGGGGANPITSQLEALRQQMMTEEQIEMESYAKRQEMLQQALAQQLVTQEEYAALMQQAQQAHSDKMGQIDVYRFGSALDKASAFFGDMASAMQGGNEEMLKISKAFGAAQALISAWQGAAEALKLPFPSNIAAFAKVLATGMGAVNAIKGVRKGGTSSGGAAASGGAATAAPAAPVQTMNFTVMNDPMGIGERFVRQFVAQLNEAQRNGMSIRGTIS